MRKNDSHTKKRPAPWAALGLLAALAGCGGGGGGIRFTPLRRRSKPRR